MSIAEKHEVGADMEAFLRLVRARALVSQGGKAKLAQAQSIIDEATKILGDLPASTEREMIETGGTP